jgi:TRAP-type C4-dicarboxylate transport system substrate-binding protein
MKKIVMFLLFATLVFGLASFMPVRAAGPIKLNYANFMPPTIPYSQLAKEFCDEINKRTGGKAEITYYPGGTLLTATKVYDGVVNDVSDIGLCHIGYARGRFPVTETLNLPVGYPSGWVATQVINDFYDKFKPKEWNDVHVLHFFGPGPQIIATTKKPVRKLEDLKGLKFRATGKLADVMKALGGIPVAVEMVDIYDGLQRGVVDGVLDSMETWSSWKTGELLKYATQSKAVGVAYPFYIIMNKSKWNNLSDDVKKVFTEVSVEWKDKYGVMASAEDITGRDFLKNHGGQIIPLSAEESARWVKAVQPVIDQHVKELEGKGFKRADSEAQVNFIRERIPYWAKQEKQRKIPTVD